MLHAFDHSVLGDDLGEVPDRWLVIGPDWAANLLEIIVLITSTGEQMIIHAMRLRATHRIPVSYTHLTLPTISPV